MSTGVRARAESSATSAALNGDDMSRLRTRPAPGSGDRRAGSSTKARRWTASRKRGSPPSRDKWSAISFSSEETQLKQRRKSPTICRTKSRLSKRLRRSARDQPLTADFWNDWLSILYCTSFLAHVGPCVSTLQIIVSPSRKSMGFLAAAVP